MNPKTKDLHLVEYFDMEYNQVKEMPEKLKSIISKFNFSFDIVSAVCRQKVSSFYFFKFYF